MFTVTWDNTVITRLPGKANTRRGMQMQRISFLRHARLLEGSLAEGSLVNTGEPGHRYNANGTKHHVPLLLGLSK